MGIRFWVAAAVLAVGGCATVWEPLGEDHASGSTPASAPSPATPDVVMEPFLEPGFPTDGLVSLGGSVEQRYPFVRFFKPETDWYIGLLVVPKGMGTPVVEAVTEYAGCLTRTERPASLRTFDKVGQGVMAMTMGAEGPPHKSDNTIKAVEDVLVVEGTEDDIDEVMTLVDFFYNQAPQIEIQAQIVELTDTQDFERGVTPIDTSTPLIGNNSGVGPNGESSFFRAFGGAFPTGTGQTLSGSGGSGGVFQVSILQNDLQLNALLQILSSVEDVDIVSRPRVVVRNGVRADLSSVEQFPILEPTNVSSQGVTSQKIVYKDVGVTLIVQPFLSSSDSIHLNVDAKVNRISRNIILTTDAEGNPIFSPIFNERRAQTNVIVRDGQTVVIGGLRLRETREAENKVPILGDIPLINLLFSSLSTEEVETEVTFMITVRIKSRAPSISAFEEDIFDPFASPIEPN